MTGLLNPLDREAWEKRLKAFELSTQASTIRVPTYLHDRYVSEAEAACNAIITDILALQSQRDAAIAEVCTLNNRIDDIDQQHDANLKDVQSQLTEALAEVERLRGETKAITFPSNPPYNILNQPLFWLYTHCRAIGMTEKSDPPSAEGDICLFTANQKSEIERLSRLAKSLERQRDEARGYSDQDKAESVKADIEKAMQPK